MKYRISGKEKLLAIGTYPAVSLLAARKARDDARTQIANGVDPSQLKRENAFTHKDLQSRTFSKVAEMYLVKIEKEDRAEATLKKNRWYLDMAIADFDKRPLNEITSPIVLQCLRKPEGRGNYETARRLRSSIGAVFRHAIAIGLADNDPTYALRDALIRPTVTHRAAITSPKALGALLVAVDGFDGQVTTKIALHLLAILAQRPGELQNARWDGLVPF